MKTFAFILYFVFPFYTLLLSSEMFYLEEAKKAEKLSQILSIPLYEKALSTTNDPIQKDPIVTKLFDLYLHQSRLEEIIILGKEHKLDPERQKKFINLNKKMAKSIGMEEEKFFRFIDLILSRDPKSKEALLEMYVEDKSIYLLNYIFAIKYKINDLESLGFLVSESPDMNPTLRLAFLVKINSRYTESYINDISKISDLTDDQRMEILYLYAFYLQKHRRYKLSARYFHMSASFEKERKGYVKMGILESAKSLFITGRRKEACELIGRKKISVINESDEFMNLYCKPKGKNELELLTPSFQVLSKRESGLLFRSYLNYTKKKKSITENEESVNENDE